MATGSPIGLLLVLTESPVATIQNGNPIGLLLALTYSDGGIVVEDTCGKLFLSDAACYGLTVQDAARDGIRIVERALGFVWVDDG